MSRCQENVSPGCRQEIESSQNLGERIALQRQVEAEACNMPGNQWEHREETSHVAPAVFWSLYGMGMVVF